MDANHPVVDIDIKSSKPVDVRVALEHWRTERRRLKGQENHSAYGLTGRGSKRVYVEPDVILGGQKDKIVWYHHNKRSIWSANLKLQSLDGFIPQSRDPLLNRIFGALIMGDDLISQSDTTLKSKNPVKKTRISIFPHTSQVNSTDEWLKQLESKCGCVVKLPRHDRIKAHESWWKTYWEKSHIHISTDKEEEKIDVYNITRGYALQRFINACAGRSSFPIKFNGSLFTTEGNDKGEWDADYRRWGGCYWWQNTRLPYWGMLNSGDFNLMRQLFNMYRNVLKIRKIATRKYYSHDGAFFPETMYFWGTYNAKNYGRNRSGKPDGFTENTYIRYYWQSGLELSLMMLDYYAFTKDEAFAKEVLIPVVSEVLTFYDQHWGRGDDGKILFKPAMSLETWQNVKNPLPEIVGITKVCSEIALLENLTTEKQRKEWRRLVSELPAVPVGTHRGKRVLKPAHELYDRPRNHENPELYAIFPYRAYGVGKADMEIALNSFAIRRIKKTGGWMQNAVKAACLGLTDEAAKLVTKNFSTWSKQHRFPAMWGPNFDWVPDQDHGSVAIIALQKMLLQYDGDKIQLLPAWPKHWDVDFKLHAPNNTTIKGTYKSGKLNLLKVQPASRKADVTIHSIKE